MHRSKFLKLNYLLFEMTTSLKIYIFEKEDKNINKIEKY
jgi:hypothetical protein